MPQHQPFLTLRKWMQVQVYTEYFLYSIPTTLLTMMLARRDRSASYQRRWSFPITVLTSSIHEGAYLDSALRRPFSGSIAYNDQSVFAKPSVKAYAGDTTMQQLFMLQYLFLPLDSVFLATFCCYLPPAGLQQSDWKCPYFSRGAKPSLQFSRRETYPCLPSSQKLCEIC